MQTFSELPLIQPLQEALVKTGYTTPTPIQAQAIPHLLAKKDLLGVAQTGTGKTAAFALPILNNLAQNPKKLTHKHARVLVLTPTRELAIQVEESFRTYSKNLHFKIAVVFGGVGQTPQVRNLAQGVDILVATPGRLLDLINQRYLSLKELEVFVLDEADRMLDMGFINDIRKIIGMLPKERHNLFFSATMPPDITKLAASILHNPVRVEVTPASSTVDIIEQRLYYVEKENKRALLKSLLADKDMKKVIMFTRTKHGADKVMKFLLDSNVSTAVIHGNKSQNARQHALENFRAGKIRVLIATDIAARGIDIDDITHVVNFELPNIAETYVHRIGRTARAGAQGKAISFCDAEERAFLKDIQKLIGKDIPVVDDHKYVSHIPMSARVASPGRAKAAIEARDNRRPRQKNKWRPRHQGSAKKDSSRA